MADETTVVDEKEQALRNKIAQATGLSHDDLKSAQAELDEYLKAKAAQPTVKVQTKAEPPADKAK